MGEGRGSGAVDGVLLANRLLLAGCFLPPAIARAANISGFAAALTMKGIPYGDVVATLVVLAEVFGPLALMLGIAPRLTAGALLTATVVTTGALHRFWDYGGLTRQSEQAVFLAHLGVVAAILFYGVTGPGAWSWQSWWRGFAERSRPAPKKKRPSKPRTSKPRPAPARTEADEDDFADAA